MTKFDLIRPKSTYLNPNQPNLTHFGLIKPIWPNQTNLIKLNPMKYNLTKLNTIWPKYTLLTRKILFDTIRPNLAIFDDIWQILICFDPIDPMWQKKANQNHLKTFWPSLTQSDIIWPAYTHLTLKIQIYPIRQNLTIFEYFDSIWPNQT